jgi:hypothetical protein
MKNSEKRTKMIEIFEKKGLVGSQIREAIDDCLALDNPSFELIEEIKKEMKAWYGFELTDSQVIEFIYYHNEQHSLDCFDTLEREDFSDYLAQKITGMEWPMNGSPQSYKDHFYHTLITKSSELGYTWLR